MNNLRLDLYKDYFLSIRRGMSVGEISNAKPVFILALLLNLESKTDNIILFEDQLLYDMYKELSLKYKQSNISPILLPFFHLRTEPFYELVWKHEVPKEKLSHTPSAKFIRENLSNAKLDEDLWELLQTPENREYLRNCIIDTYLK